MRNKPILVVDCLNPSMDEKQKAMSLRHPISKNFVHQVLHGIFVANDSADGVWVPASQEQVGAHKHRALARGRQTKQTETLTNAIDNAHGLHTCKPIRASCVVLRIAPPLRLTV
jgi:hypothetical protein